VTQKMYRTLFGYLFTCLFIIVGSGCSSGSGDPAITDTTTSVTAENYIDIAAIAGPIVAARVGEVVTLNDTKSYARPSESMTYSWSFSYRPAGSNAELQGPTTATPSFVADVRGTYMLQLVVSAEGVTSQRAITTVVVTNPGEKKPTGPFNHDGLSSQCVLCHDGVNLKSGGELLLPKVPDHHATSNMCEACHTPLGFATTAFVDHQEVFGNCSECHNGILAIGKSPFHTPTEAECDDCHNTTAFLELNPDGSFDHSGITRVCSSCHNGDVATGKTSSTDDIPPGTHPATDSECGYCHTTLSFLDAYPDHTGPDVVGPGITCDSCHVADGSGSALGQSVGHPVTNIDCDTCHSIVSFKMPGGIFNHSLVDATVQPCESCHNDSTSINAPGLTPTHSDTKGQDCGVCHNTVSFADAIFDHTGIVSDCGLTCHVADGSGTAGGMPISTPFYAHMPTSEDCSACHTPGTFSTGTFSHAPIYIDPPALCADCHNDVISVGKLSNHIPTNLDCADCHNTTTFTGAIFDHAAFDTSNCALCHDGDIALGKSPNHVATSQDCSSCHVTNTYATFAGTFDHGGIDPNDCASCHATGIAKPKIANHIPAQGDCSVCHVDTNTGGFVSSTFMATVHPGISNGCEGCHNGRFSTISGKLYGKPADHLPTAQDCDVCHTNTAFNPSIFNHSGITGNCISCHDGTHDNDGTGAIGMTPDHPATNGQDCGVCHNTTSFLGAFVDHSGPAVVGKRCDSCHNGADATGKGAKVNPPHVPTTQDCGVCHTAGGSFTPAVFDHGGIVDNCASCHDGVAATGMSQGHLQTAQDCSVCHNTTAFAGARFDHTGITGNCDSCHNGITARGKTPPPDHVPTNQDCNTCHVTTGFIPATFSHDGIVDNCRSCHNNVFAIGKSVNHVPTNQDCGICHNTRTFVGAVFDHTGIVDNCSSCHGVTATGKHSAHIATSMDCHFCHTTASFVGGTWFHDASTAGQCDTCHSPGNGATFKPQGHLSTTFQCDECHSTNGWAPDIFSHSSQGGYPGDHRRNPGCSACHGNTIDDTLPYPHPQYAPPQRNTVYCAACHANDFESEGDHIGGRNGTVEQNKDCSGGGRGCHSVTNSGF
jgi:hypothetical protein